MLAAVNLNSRPMMTLFKCPRLIPHLVVEGAHFVAALLAVLARHLERLSDLLEREATNVEVEEHPARRTPVIHLLLAVVAQRVPVSALQK